jgi:hypothetical protein
MTTRRGPEHKRRLREERSLRTVDAAVSLTREHGLRVEEPVVLNDLISLMVHLRPAPVVARVATYMPRLRLPLEDWLEREIAVTTYLAEQGARSSCLAESCRPAPTSVTVPL